MQSVAVKKEPNTRQAADPLIRYTPISAASLMGNRNPFVEGGGGHLSLGGQPLSTRTPVRMDKRRGRPRCRLNDNRFIKGS